MELAGRCAERALPTLTGGRIELDGRPVPALPAAARTAAADGRHWVLELHEGRKRQIRRMFGRGRRQGDARCTAWRSARSTLGRLHPGDFRRLTAPEDGGAAPRRPGLARSTPRVPRDGADPHGRATNRTGGSMMDFKSLFRPGILADAPLQPPASPIEEVQRELGLDDVIKLASNENPEGPAAGGGRGDPARPPAR